MMKHWKRAPAGCVKFDGGAGAFPRRAWERVIKLIVDHGVATLPLSAFYSDGTDQAVIRLTFSKDDETLEEGARRLCEV